MTIVADDLTGAADAAGAYGETYSSAIVFGVDGSWPDAEILAVDTESRHLPEIEAAELVASAVRRSVLMGRPVFKKIDSLLRGNVGAEVSAALAELAHAERGIAVVAPAFPATGRTTFGGVVHVDGVPHTAGPFQGNIVWALSAGGLKTGHLATTSRSPEELAKRVHVMHGEGFDAVVLDATNDADLKQIARAMKLLDLPALIVGSGGLASHVAPARPRGDQNLADRFNLSRVLIVVGSYSVVARSQIQALLKDGIHHVELNLDNPSKANMWTQLAHSSSDTLLTPDLAAPVAKENAAAVAAMLAATVRAIVDDYDALVLTGGETARAVVDALGVDHLRVLGEIEPGVVLSELPRRGQLVVTKSGAFGDPETLARVVNTLKTTTKKVNIQ